MRRLGCLDAVGPSPSSMPQRLVLAPYPDFATASAHALRTLEAQFHMGLWMVTRTVGDDWIVLEAVNTDSRYAVASGDVFSWSDSFCSRMVEGRGPSIAPRSSEVPAYREAPVGRAMPIESYVGIPIRRADGELFGTLCAIDPAPRGGELDAVAPLVEVVGSLLATVLDAELRREADTRRVEAAEATAMLDALTDLWNRRAWDSFKAREEGRCRRHGHPACVMSIDLDGLKEANDARGHEAGDVLLRTAAIAIKAAVRQQDIVARLGGDEFGVMLVECREEQAGVVLSRIEANLKQAGVAASIGVARRAPDCDLDAAWRVADARMYEQKRAHHASGGATT